MLRRCALLLVLLLGTEVSAETIEGRWKLASSRERDGFPLALYVETEKTPGRPAFRIETRFGVSPAEAASTLMEEMVSVEESKPGERRRLMERREREALVHTFIDLPFMFSDRELAVRIRHADDARTGIHRIEWVDENDALPPAVGSVLRLQTEGYWEFRPDGRLGTLATYLSRAEVGGSLPSAMSDRLMRARAIEAVVDLQTLIGDRTTTNVAAPPPDGLLRP